jgi:hypothetical protein
MQYLQDIVSREERTIAFTEYICFITFFLLASVYERIQCIFGLIVGNCAPAAMSRNTWGKEEKNLHIGMLSKQTPTWMLAMMIKTFFALMLDNQS